MESAKNSYFSPLKNKATKRNNAIKILFSLPRKVTIQEKIVTNGIPFSLL